MRSSRKNPPAGIEPMSAIVGVPSTPLKTQPDKLIGLEPGFHNSIHSSLEEAAVPAQAISLMITLRNPTGVGVIVLVGVTVAVGITVLVAVAVGVPVLVEVPVFVTVGVSEGVLVGVEVGGTAPQRLRGEDEF